MSLDTSLASSLNAFSPFVTIPSAILQSLQDGLQALQEEVAILREEHDKDREEIVAMRMRLTALESTEEQDISRLALDIALDRQRLARLEKVEPQPLQKDRGEILRALLAANGGKMLAKDARKRMHLSKDRFSKLLATCDFIERKPYHLDRRQDVIILKS